MEHFKMKFWEKAIIYVILTFFSLLAIVPTFVLVSRSFFSLDEITSLGAGVFPHSPTLDAYVTAFTDEGFLTSLKNTLLTCLCAVIGVPLTAFMAAYAFTRIKFFGRRFWFLLGLGTIMIPSILLLIPVYSIFVDMGWTNTLLPLTVTYFFGGGIMNIFLIMQFIRGLPKDMYEAAEIDGAGTLRQMFQLTLPLVKPVVAYAAVTAFIGAWNDVMRPLMYNDLSEYYTVNQYIYITYLQQTATMDALPNVQMALGVILMIPMLIIFIVFQKQLIEGIRLSGEK